MVPSRADVWVWVTSNEERRASSPTIEEAFADRYASSGWP